MPTRSVLDHWGAALSHRSAATLWQLLPPKDGLINVSVPGIGGKKRQREVHIHRSRTLIPEVVTSHRGIPVTTPARTIDDLQRAHRTRGCPAAIPSWELRRAIRQAEVLGLPTGAEGLTKRTRSDLELLFLRLCRRHGLPRPEINAKIGSIEVDFLWRERQVVAETDGYIYHRGKVAFEDDHARDLKLRELGYEVIRLSERQVVEEQEQVVEALRGAIARENRGDG
jgi:very-short-patch-repair endonuclease